MRKDIAQLSAHLPLESERSCVTGHRRNRKAAGMASSIETKALEINWTKTLSNQL